MLNSSQREAILSPIRQEIAALVAQLPAQEGAHFQRFADALLGAARPSVFEDEAKTIASRIRSAWSTTAAADPSAVNVSVDEVEGGLQVVVVMTDQPFIIDTVRQSLWAAGASHVRALHIVQRISHEDGQARLVDVGGNQESISIYLTEGIESGRAADVAEDVRKRLHIARVMVADHRAMMDEVAAIASRAGSLGGEDYNEAAEFLRWLLSDNFVFVGLTRTSSAETVQLGADRFAGDPLWTALWPAADLSAGNSIIAVRKESVEAPIHRNGRIDGIRLQLYGETLVIRGMFTRRALTLPCRHLPILRRMLQRILDETAHRPNSYRYRGLANIFDSLPTEWLFSAEQDQIADVLERMFDAEQEHITRSHITQRDDGSATFVFVAIPERRYSDAIRSKVLGHLTELTGANYTESGIFAGRFDTVLLQVYQTGTRALSAADIEGFQTFTADLTTPWAERVVEHLDARFGDAALTLMRRYADAFPSEYRDETSTALSVQDIAMLEEARSSGRVRVLFFEDGGELLLRVYQNADVLLTELMPIIDNFGLVVSDQYSTPVQPAGLSNQQIDTFRVVRVAGLSREEITARAPKMVAGLEAVFARHITSDAYNRLLLAADLNWEEVDLVRACFGYARQLQLRHPISRIQEILLKQAACAGAIVRLFNARFNPDFDGDRAAAVAAAAEGVQDHLRQIKTNDEDVVMRTLANIVESMLRTNFFRHDRKFHYISFKIDHLKVRNMPAPRMMVEIYVHHREMEGVHLRGGPIARGGIRFSDRADFRTEILGLVTTQMVKNVVIVPEGSKGGFYIKYTIDDPKEYRRKGDELYQVLIRGMLDVTDNYVAGKVVRPNRVVAHDGDDPYLVVAADKGTAHLSDTANRLSREYGFWLDDAFASGGSNGYDHKVVGITARGAWVLVRRHFREMGRDPDQELFTCIGVGDTSGDVFGNGVIETPKMRLLAAFNHVHIFLDPDPDAEVTFRERRRLFDAVKGWDAYDRSLISKGGGIFDRKAKSIALTPEVRAMLGTLQEEATPEEVISLILKMPVDLFWNGGIGTYVRASFETNADANDPPNDDLRVTALDLRCKIVGEGGNLGFTSAARVEYALNGGRLNTDFVDNSGGVDTSDHEVNLKILLNPLVAAGRLTRDERNTFLRSLTTEVADAVLADNNANGRLISLDVVRSANDPTPFSRTIEWICARGNVTRRFLVLPSDDDLRRRAASRQGLTRPEISVIQAHVKMHIFKMLMQEDHTLIPGFDQLLQNYFPAAVRERFGADVPNHMLAKAIGMTVLLTEIATDAGSTFFPMMMDLTGASPGRIAAAWRTAFSYVNGEELRATLATSRPRPELAHRAWTLLTDGVQRLALGWLAPGSNGPNDLGTFHAAMDALAATRSSGDTQAFRQQIEDVGGKGLGADLAERIVHASDATLASEICAVAAARSIPLQSAAVLYQAVGHASRLLPTLRAIGTRRGTGRWDPVALGILRLRYQSLLRDAATHAPLVGSLSLGVDRAADELSAGKFKDVARVIDRVLGDSPDVAALLVGEQQIRAVIY